MTNAGSGDALLDSLTSKPNIRSAILFDRRGVEVSRFERDGVLSHGSRLPIKHDLNSRTLRGPCVHVSTRTRERRRGGSLSQSGHGRAFHAMVQQLWLFVIVLVAAVAIAFSMASVFRKAITDPIDRLTIAAKLVSDEQDFSINVDRSSDDEVGDLTDAFNDMLWEIGTRNHELLRAHDELEARVEKRTRDLADEKERRNG